jgi:hypothetical protein
MTYGTANIDAIATSSGQILGAGDSTAFKNRIINGAMVIDQRATPVTTSGYTVDRFYYNTNVASKGTAAQSTSVYPTGYKASLGFTSSSAYTISSGDYFGFQQPIEGLNVVDLAWGTASAISVTISFWVYSSLTGTFGGSLRNSAANRSYVFSYTINNANTWEQKTVNIIGDTSGTWLTTNGVGIFVNFSIGQGSTNSGIAGSWSGSNYTGPTGQTSVVGTNGATFYITGIQLEVGSQATSFDYRDYGRELMLCQRYFVNYAGTNIAMNPSGSNGNNANSAWIFGVPMRSAPTSSNITGIIQSYTTNYTLTSVSLSTSANGVGYFVSTNSTGNPGYASWYMFEPTTCFMSAEL